MYLGQIKFIDLKTSKWDHEKSNPANGDYYFTDKRYINYRGDRAAAPPFKFMWNRWNPKDNYRDISDWQIKYKASFVSGERPVLAGRRHAPEREIHRWGRRADEDTDYGVRPEAQGRD